jgi:hypothetical protein
VTAAAIIDSRPVDHFSKNNRLARIQELAQVMNADSSRNAKDDLHRQKDRKMNSTLPTPRMYRRRRPTPWPIRIFLIVAIAFGIWVDVSTPDSNGNSATDPSQTPLIGLTGEHSVAANIVRTLATRHP